MKMHFICRPRDAPHTPTAASSHPLAYPPTLHMLILLARSFSPRTLSVVFHLLARIAFLTYLLVNQFV